MSKKAVLLLQKTTLWVLTNRNFHPRKLWWLRVFGIIAISVHDASSGELFLIEFLQKPVANRGWLYRYLRYKLIRHIQHTHTAYVASRIQHVLTIVTKYDQEQQKG